MKHPRKLYKSTIVTWSEFDPSTVELSRLAQEAETGDAYCSKHVSEHLEEFAEDPDWDGTEFFGDEDEEPVGTLHTSPVYRVSANVGKAKHAVSYHDGEKKHKDGSPFYDIAVFKNKPARDKFIKGLRAKGYTEI
jgi:hypothetical protein